MGTWQPMGDRVGWVDNENLYLEPTQPTRSSSGSARRSAIASPSRRRPSVSASGSGGSSQAARPGAEDQPEESVLHRLM